MLPTIMHGTVLGLSVAAPFGPVSLLCMQRSLMGRPCLAVVSGLGAATAHGAFAGFAIAASEIAASALAAWRTPIHLLSAVILIALGLRTLLRRRASGARSAAGRPHAAYVSGLLLALSNPMTILPYLAIASAMAGAGVAGGSFWEVPGVMFGATFWYTVVSGGTALLRRGVAQTIVPRLNIAAGIALIGFGILIGFG